MESTKKRIIFYLCCFCSTFLLSQTKATYAGGGFYNERVNIKEIRKSGFNTLIIWTMHLTKEGDINLNFDFDLITKGKYVGDETRPKFVKDLARLKKGKSTIKRIELGIGSWEGQQFEIIKSFYERDGGFPETSPIYKNFKKLRETFPMVDAINNDDELTYDLPSAVAFTKMLAELGFKNTIVPYKNNRFWSDLVREVNSDYPMNIDRNYLQCYAGGAKNNPCDESWNFGLEIIPGLWGGNEQLSALEIHSKMKEWYDQCRIDGGFIWLYDNIKGKAQEYSSAIHSFK